MPMRRYARSATGGGATGRQRPISSPAAPDLFSEELAHCFVLLAQAPIIGKPYRRHASVAGLRRAVLRVTRYHVCGFGTPEACGRSRRSREADWLGCRSIDLFGFFAGSGVQLLTS